MPSTSITAFLDEPYPEHLTLREARGIYFARNGLGDGGYDKKWVHSYGGQDIPPAIEAFVGTADLVERDWTRAAP